MSSKLTEDVVHLKGRHLAQLVNGDIHRIASGYDAKIRDGSGIDILIASTFPDPTGDTICAARGMATQHLHAQAAYFRQRMVGAVCVRSGTAGVRCSGLRLPQKAQGSVRAP